MYVHLIWRHRIYSCILVNFYSEGKGSLPAGFTAGDDPPTVWEALFTARHQKTALIVCVCVCVYIWEIVQGRMKADTLHVSTLSILSLQYSGRDSWKSSEPSNITWLTHLCQVFPFKQIQSSLNHGLLVHCYLIIHVCVANKQFSCQTMEGTCFI